MFKLTLGGRINKVLKIETLKIRNNYADGRDFFRLVLELIFVGGVIYFFWDAVKKTKKLGWVYLEEGGWVNFFGTFLYTVNILLWIILSVENNKVKTPDAPRITQAPMEIQTFTRQFDSLSWVHAAYSLSNQASIFLNMVRVVVFLEFHNRLSIITKTLGACMADLLHFFILFITLFVLFAYMGFKVLGHQMFKFHTMGESMQTLSVMVRRRKRRREEKRCVYYNNQNQNDERLLYITDVVCALNITTRY